MAIQLGAKNSSKKIKNLFKLIWRLFKDGELDIPVEGGAPVRRRSINLWRPIAGIFSVNLREENVDEAPISPGPESDPYDQGPHEAIQVNPFFIWKNFWIFASEDNKSGFGLGLKMLFSQSLN